MGVGRVGWELEGICVIMNQSSIELLCWIDQSGPSIGLSIQPSSLVT